MLLAYGTLLRPRNFIFKHCTALLNQPIFATDTQRNPHDSANQPL